jgi:hypothetical protein
MMSSAVGHNTAPERIVAVDVPAAAMRNVA